MSFYVWSPRCHIITSSVFVIVIAGSSSFQRYLWPRLPGVRAIHDAISTSSPDWCRSRGCTVPYHHLHRHHSVDPCQDIKLKEESCERQPAKRTEHSRAQCARTMQARWSSSSVNDSLNLSSPLSLSSAYVVLWCISLSFFLHFWF